MIEARLVRKSYGGKVVLKDLSLKVPAEKVVAILGPNGAGKTTFLKALLNLIRFDGDISIFGVSSRKYIARTQLCYLPEKFSFYPYYKVKGTLKFYGELRGLKGKELRQKVEQSAGLLKISEVLDQRISTLSKGQMQRVGLAMMDMAFAKFYILDEPHSGLDPIGIKDLKEVIKSWKDRGASVLINSHILSEMEAIADEIGILNRGELVHFGPLSEILAKGKLEDFFYQLVKGGDNG